MGIRVEFLRLEITMCFGSRIRGTTWVGMGAANVNGNYGLQRESFSCLRFKVPWIRWLDTTV